MTPAGPRALRFALAGLLAAPLCSAQEADSFRPTLDLSGWAQLDYRSAGAADASPEHDLTPRRVRVRFAGLAAPRLRYAVGFEGDNAASGGASVLEVWATYQIAGWLRADLGQFKYDFDVIGRESPTATILADKPWVTNAVAGSLDGTSTASRTSSRFRDRGVALSGRAGEGAVRVGYSAGLFLGAGRGGDDNSSLTAVARLQLSPARTPLLLSGGVLAGPTGPHATGDYRGWTAGAVWDTPRFYARAEYYAAERDRGAVVQELDGYYVVGVVTTHPSLDLSARYQRLHDTAGSSTGALTSVDLGAEWFLRRRGRNAGTSIAANLMLRDAPDAASLSGVTLLGDGRGGEVASGADLGAALLVRLQVEF